MPSPCPHRRRWPGPASYSARPSFQRQGHGPRGRRYHDAKGAAATRLCVCPPRLFRPLLAQRRLGWREHTAEAVRRPPLLDAQPDDDARQGLQRSEGDQRLAVQGGQQGQGLVPHRLRGGGRAGSGTVRGSAAAQDRPPAPFHGGRGGLTHAVMGKCMCGLGYEGERRGRCGAAAERGWCAAAEGRAEAGWHGSGRGLPGPRTAPPHPVPTGPAARRRRPP